MNKEEIVDQDELQLKDELDDDWVNKWRNAICIVEWARPPMKRIRVLLVKSNSGFLDYSQEILNLQDSFIIEKAFSIRRKETKF